MKKGIQFLLVMCFALTLMGCQSEKKEEVKDYPRKGFITPLVPFAER